MENSYFIFTNNDLKIEIERFHICTWEFENSSLIEFGCEIAKESLNGNSISLSISIPWITDDCEITDLYNRLSSSENSRFIFNDSVTATTSLDGGRNKMGVVHQFQDRYDLCILPIVLKNIDRTITVNLNLQEYQKLRNKPNIYIRFFIKPKFASLSTRKGGIGKSTVIYDIKVNERRNIPDDQLALFSNREFCKIKKCFLFNIIPNKYDIVFVDSVTLKNVRTLEYESFNKYLEDSRVKKDDLIVLFSKKENADSFSFFSIYAKERIGHQQIAIAMVINIISGILLFIPSYRNNLPVGVTTIQMLKTLPIEIFIALSIVLSTLVYFIWPSIEQRATSIRDFLVNKFEKK